MSIQLGPAMMADVKDIEHTLEDAQYCNAELNSIHFELQKLQTNDEIREIEVKMAKLFRRMMSASYTVLDQCYYHLYCHFQNQGKLSFRGAAYNIKTPVKQKLKRSKDERRDSAYMDERKKFVNDQCKLVFGERGWNKEKKRALRLFQENLLKLQAITEVDDSCRDEAPPKLVWAKDIKHASEPETQESHLFHPIDVEFEELESVEDLDSWNETTRFNLLHFFRNFTTHRALISCAVKPGYLNWKTREFKAEGDGGAGVDCSWVKIGIGAWIMVPEISHLKQEKREAPPTFYVRSLLLVCSQILSFVKRQKSFLLGMAD